MGMIPQGRDGLDLLTIALNERKYIGAKVVGNEEEIVREIARLLEHWGVWSLCDCRVVCFVGSISSIVGDFNMVLQIFECQRVFITTGGELVTMNALLAVPVV
ncbi:hypothetical protein V6N11_058278 [Hibiscus sabdariffa]|uniref:Uncharacterized protein n=1 Tax=Hibiscus sabdariffa TaxID=183260 RepID=A0ABR1ZE84_9ROSI